MFSISPKRFHSLLIAPMLLPLLFPGGSDSSSDPSAPIETSYTAHGTLFGSFPFNQPIRIVSTGQVSHGTLRVFGSFNGFSQVSFIYFPNDGYVGPDSFTYHACDSSGNCIDGTIDINVVNNPPDAVDDHYTVHGTLFGGGSTPLTVNDSDPDGDPIRIVSVTSPAHGTLNYVFSTDSFVYNANSGFSGTDTVTYKLCDSLGLCDTATVTFDVVNNAPLAKGDNYTIQVNQTLSASGPESLVANDSDPDNDPFSVTAYTQPAFGTLTNSTTDGVFTYRPGQDFVGQDSFTYTICDYLGACATAIASINVEGPTPTPTPTPVATPTPTPTPPPPPSPSPTPTPTPPEPLIFIPGITGSTLKGRAGYEYWVGGVGTSYDLLTLDPTKPQPDIIATDVFRKTTIFGKDIDGYEKLLNMLTSTGGYREYKVNNDPARRTTAGCDLNQKSSDPSKNPSLFLFAYDWRKSNADNAKLLKDYIGCVKQFYPDSQVNLLTHSMGGYIAQRYILDNPNVHGVKRVVAIASPWLGAPKALYALETGKFFDTGDFIANWLGNRLFAPLFKSLVEFFPSVHQILPSPQYHNLGGQDLGEISGPRNWDINENGRLDNDYTPEEVAALLDNVQFKLKQAKPGQAGLIFHNNPGQDDWRMDQSGVRYCLLYGIQYYKLTIGKVFAVNKFVFDSEGRVTQIHDYTVGYTQGDGTAPLLSTERIGRGMDLNGSAVKRIPFPSTKEHFRDPVVEHTGLTANPEVWDAILDSLKSTSQQARAQTLRDSTYSLHHGSSRSRRSSLSLQEPTTLDSGEAYYLTITGADRVGVTDSQGNSNAPLEGTAFDQRVPGVVISQNETSADVNFGAELSSDESYTLTFRSLGKPIEIGLTKGKGNAPEDATQIIRYLDVNLAAGTEIMLKITALGVENAGYDADGDGIFESALNPTALAIGESARDAEAPVITFNEMVMGTNRVLSINAADNASGVKIVRYSLDGIRYQPYAGPISVNACDARTVYAIADDNVANRSGVFTYELPNLPPDVSRAQPSIATLWPPDHKMVEVSVLGVTDPDCDPLTVTITRITQNEPTNGTGDGDTCPDALGVGTPSAQLRAERSAGNGRVYTIYFIADDGRGGVAHGKVKVSVARNSYGAAVDDGPVFDSTLCSP